ncbi:MAG: hypothetical protein DELT_02875 [Desulfovibrio sp.]
MPVLPTPKYKAPFWLPGGNAQTMGPRLACFVPPVSFTREQLELADGDFILLDWLFASGSHDTPADKVAVLSHGLEGDSTRSYMRALALVLAKRGWDVISRNFRGCGGAMNRLPRLYHSGETDDLAAVISLAEERGYRHVALAGFSMGGNQVLKYLGEHAASLPASVVAGAAVSVPCDLTGCSLVLSKPRNRMYMEYFLRTLRRKIRDKHEVFPSLFSVAGLNAIKTFKEFDDRYTAPLGGFKDAEDYWAKGACLPYLPKIAVPALILNAKNDPFLSERCYPVKEAEENPHLYLLMPETGGHVGFPTKWGKTPGWLEETVADFLERKR